MGQKIKNFCPRFSAPMSLKNKFFLDFFVYFLEVLLFYPLNSSRYPYVRIYLKILQKKCSICHPNFSKNKTEKKSFFENGVRVPRGGEMASMCPLTPLTRSNLTLPYRCIWISPCTMWHPQQFLKFNPGASHGTLTRDNSAVLWRNIIFTL